MFLYTFTCRVRRYSFSSLCVVSETTAASLPPPPKKQRLSQVPSVSCAMYPRTQSHASVFEMYIPASVPESGAWMSQFSFAALYRGAVSAQTHATLSHTCAPLLFGATENMRTLFSASSLLSSATFLNSFSFGLGGWLLGALSLYVRARFRRSCQCAVPLRKTIPKVAYPKPIL